MGDGNKGVPSSGDSTATPMMADDLPVSAEKASEKSLQDSEHSSGEYPKGLLLILTLLDIICGIFLASLDMVSSNTLPFRPSRRQWPRNTNTSTPLDHRRDRRPQTH
ncbi:hypothetical protein IMZ48_14510 [Candidatus Bathyarchaeota archaeon]|nr:hypothetical protein [Candidatus Bathyarchaeota archaeon]